MSSKTLSRSRFTVALAAVTGIALVTVAAPAQATHGAYWTHLKCTLGAGTLIQMDVSMQPPPPNRDLYTLTREDYSTVAPVRVDKVQLMIQRGGDTVYSTIYTWGDGTAGSVNSSFGSTGAAGTPLAPGLDKLKMKVSASGQYADCIPQVVGGGHS